LAIILALVLVVLTAYQVGKRIAWDGSSKKYSIAVRRSDLDQASSIYGETKSHLTEKLKQRGLDLLLFEYDLITNEELQVSPGLKEYRQAGIELGLEVRNLQLANEDEFDALVDLMNAIKPSYLHLGPRRKSGYPGRKRLDSP